MVVGYGDRAEEMRQADEYRATQEYLKENASIYGWPYSLADLSGSEAALLVETFQGTARLQPPDAVSSCRLEIELLVDSAPRACLNFAELCAGWLNKQGVRYTYVGTAFHRYVKGFCLQGGDVNGRGGDSIYGGAFKDEKGGLKVLHEFGCVSMANSGPNTNRSQFFFCLSREAAKSIDGKHVVFGKVVNDAGLAFLREVDESLGRGGADGDERPPVGCDVFVIDAGC